MDKAKEILKKYFGYEAFRPQQEEIINTVLNKKDAFVLMPTGGGKSICYQVPAMLLEGVTVVVSPLISLMKDQVDSLRSNGIKAEYLNSSLTNKESEDIIQKCRNGEIKILYVSPEKMIASLDWFIKQLKVELVAIDEAHCISSWGHDFRPEYKLLYRIREVHPNATMMALTATADRLTQKDILEFLGLHQPVLFNTSFDRPNISLSVKFGLKSKDKLKDILDVIDRHKGQSGIIYCTSKKSTEALAGELQHAGINAAFYHAGMNAESRSRIQENFIKDEISIVCATIAFGMGIDKSNVRFVLHYNLPKTIENYYQEIGRGGRDGSTCFTRLYWSLGDIILLRSFANDSGAQQINLEKLNRMQEFAESKVCRRKVLLNYFGENLRENCGNCDICKNPPSHFDGTIHTQKVLSAIKRSALIGQKLTIATTINVLRGSRAHEIIEKKLDSIKTYGAGKDLGYQEWNYYLLQMIQNGALQLMYEDGNTLQVTPFGDMILRNEFAIDLITPSHEEKEPSRGKSSPRSVPVDTLFESLRQHRKRLAELENVPPYIIFHDTTLHEMVEKLPLTAEEMMEVGGMSEAKFDKYGYEFLDILLKNSPAAYKKKVPISEALSKEKIELYAKELESVGVSLSGTAIAKLLLGDQDSRYADKAKEVSFFGILRGDFKVRELFDRIKPLLDPIQQEWSDSKNQHLFDLTDNYLKNAQSSSLSASDKLFFEQQSRLLPPSPKEDKEGPFRRSGSKWSDQETALLADLAAHTSNIQEICELLQRSERGVRFALLNFVKAPREQKV